ncbi:MAG: HAD-superfamily hydrolase, subfamily variant 3 [Moraxellaceae bacterium]|jgi:putative hydrolase of the HAD superfamily|nr:HAD-superfamily hydrolase, subfamily variant 3 [Moraxellaceae bacterium]
MQALVDWSRIDTVLLDMDGTLLDLYFDNHFWLHHLPAIYGRERGMETDAARADLVARFGREQGTLNWYCVDFWSRELGLDVAALKKDIAHLIQPRPGALGFLQAVADSGRQAWLVTNAHHHSLSLKLAHTPLTALCQRIVCSHDFREPKESAAFWPALQAREPFEPARALFVDDSEPVLQAAANYGIGQLLTIGQPDLSKPAREGLRFPVLHHFDDLLPIPPRHE